MIMKTIQIEKRFLEFIHIKGRIALAIVIDNVSKIVLNSKIREAKMIFATFIIFAFSRTFENTIKTISSLKRQNQIFRCISFFSSFKRILSENSLYLSDLLRFSFCDQNSCLKLLDIEIHSQGNILRNFLNLGSKNFYYLNKIISPSRCLINSNLPSKLFLTHNWKYKVCLLDWPWWLMSLNFNNLLKINQILNLS